MRRSGAAPRGLLVLWRVTAGCVVGSTLTVIPGTWAPTPTTFSSSIGNGGWDDLWYRVIDGYYVADVDIDTGTFAPLGPQC